MASGEIGPEGGCLYFSYDDDDDSDIEELNVADGDSDDSVECDFAFFNTDRSAKKASSGNFDGKSTSRTESDSVPAGASRGRRTKERRRNLKDKLSVIFPKLAVAARKYFRISPKLQEHMIPGYCPISIELTCEPSITFDQPVDINLPIWCSTDDSKVEVEVKCQSKDEGEYTLIKKAKLKDLSSEIKFQSSHFSSFTVWIREKFLKKIKLSMNMDIWKTDLENYTFVAYINDNSVKAKWKKDLKEKGYKPTQAAFNPVSIRHNDTINVSFGMERFPLKTDFVVFDVQTSRHYFVNFVLPEVSLTERHISLNCHVTQLSHEKKSSRNFDIKKTWRENNTSVRSNTGPDERIDDVFLTEVAQAFHGPTWYNFVISRDGLRLSSSEYDTICHDHRGSIDRIKMEALNRWKTKLGREESATIMEMRKIVDKFRETM